MNFFQIFYQPFLNALVIIYQYLPGRNFGLAIIVLTILIRLFLYPFASEAIRVQKVTALIQPKIKEIKKKHKNDKEKQTLLMMELFREHKINPLGNLLLLVVQIPIMIGLYYVFYYGINPETLSNLYSFVPKPGEIDSIFFGVDLAKGSALMAVLAALLQYYQTKMVTDLTNKDFNRDGEVDMMEEVNYQMQKYLLYVFPLITVFIFYKLPAALSLYWITSSAFSIIQQHIVLKEKKPADAVALKNGA